MKEERFIQTDAGNAEKKEINLKEVKRALDGYYYDIDLVLEVLRQGKIVRTSFYFYEMKK